MAALVRENKTALMAERDPEDRYYQASILAFCGQEEVALALLHSAIQQNYCAYSALQSDLLLAKFRSMPEFNKLLTAAKDCQNKVLAQK